MTKKRMDEKTRIVFVKDLKKWFDKELSNEKIQKNIQKKYKAKYSMQSMRYLHDIAYLEEYHEKIKKDNEYMAKIQPQEVKEEHNYAELLSMLASKQIDAQEFERTVNL